MDNHENKHCVETAYSCVWHYKTNNDGNWVACGEKDNPGRCEVTPKSNSYPRLAFRMPEQRHDLASVLVLMEAAYRRGRADNRNELAALLKSLINV